MKSLILLGLVLCLSLPLASARAEDKGYDSDFSLLSFHVNQLSVFQSGGNSFSGQVGWAPGIKLTQHLLVHFDGSFGLLKGVTTNFAMIDYQLLAGWTLDNFVIEAGGGAQTWFTQTTAPEISGVVSYLTKDRFLYVLDRVYVGYSAFLASGAFTSEIKVGVGMVF